MAVTVPVTVAGTTEVAGASERDAARLDTTAMVPVVMPVVMAVVVAMAAAGIGILDPEGQAQRGDDARKADKHVTTVWHSTKLLYARATGHGHPGSRGCHGAA